MNAPHRIARLAKKSHQRLPTIIVVQNVLMKKLGIAFKPHVESTDFEWYINLFRQGLSMDQAKQMSELPKGVVDPDNVERPGY
jgi:hypothetical protein